MWQSLPALQSLMLSRARLAVGSLLLNRCSATKPFLWPHDPESQALALTTASQGTNAAPGDSAEKIPSQPIIIVGGGLAGLSAATEVLAQGGKVVIVEKMEKLGGNSTKASSGMNAAGSEVQTTLGLDDSPDLLFSDTVKSGRGRSSEPLVKELVAHSADAVRFLQSLGVNLGSIQQLGGHSRPRTHRTLAQGVPMNFGNRVMLALIGHLQEEEKLDSSRVKISLSTVATQLLTRPTGAGVDRVVGVRVKCLLPDGSHTLTKDVKGAAVILSTGGYSADREGLLREYAPRLRSLPTTSGTCAMGDGVRLAAALGAVLKDMDQVQMHPTGLVDPSNPSNPVKLLGPESLRGSGGLLLNSRGERFVNELDTRDKVVSAMMEHCSPLPGGRVKTACHVAEEGEASPVPQVMAHLLLSDETIHKFGDAIADFYLSRGLLQKFSSLEELCSSAQLSFTRVVETLKAYDEAAAGQRADSFGKTTFPCLYRQYYGTSAAARQASGGDQHGTPPVYLALVTPALHYCMGGLAFDPLGHVLRETSPEAVTIPGLFAAGEVTGGLHGANRLAGNSLLECVVFGRIAARTAMAEAVEQQELRISEEWINVADEHMDSRALNIGA